MWIKLVSPRVTMRPVDSGFKRQMAPPLALLVLGALTPRRHRVTVADENVEALETGDAPGLVGVSVKADTAGRAFEIARAYRRRGVPVVFGGIYATTCPEEALAHADAVVAGEAEGVWGRVLEDAERGALRGVYRDAAPPDLALSPVPRWELLARGRYLYTNTLTIGRGCPWRCDFCYNSAPGLPRGYRAKPVGNVLREVASLGSRHVMFIDDNFIADPAYAGELLAALAPLGLVWHTAVSADIGAREGLLDRMAAAGCKSLFVGFESLSAANLRAAGKRQNRVGAYERTIRAIHDRGMMVNASVVFGFDGDGPGVFADTTDWLVAQRAETMTAHILTPYPGTRLHARLEAEGRIFDRDLSHYNTSRAVFTPRGMSAGELEAGYLGAYRSFYSWGSIAKRLPGDARRRTPYLLFNLGYRKAGRMAAAFGALGLMRGLGRLGAALSYAGAGRAQGLARARVPLIIALLAAGAAWAEPRECVDVTRYGAVPGDGGDDMEAFAEAARVLHAGGLRRFVIPPGRYRLSAGGGEEGGQGLLRFSRLDGLRVEGAGAELEVTGDAGLFRFERCRKVAVRGLTVDWPRPPFSVGTVTASAPRHFDVAVEAEYPVAGGEPVGAFMDYDPVTRLPAGRDVDVYGAAARTELLGPQLLRVHLARDVAVRAGALLVLRHRVYGGNAFVFDRCADVEVSDTRVYAAPGMGLVAGVCENVTLRRFDVLKRPGTRRPMSATADAAHFGGCRGTVTLEDCTFEGMGDDGANVKSGLYLTVTRLLDERAVLARHNLRMIDLPDPGDTLELSRPDTLLAYASARVRDARVTPGADNEHRIVFEGAPAGLRVGDVLGNASRAPALRMRRCTVRDNRARGVLCQTRDARIEDCTFRGCTSAGVMVLTEVVHFHESIGARDVTVARCRFENCNRGAASAEAALCAVAYLKDFGYPPAPGVHRDVRFEGNRIVGTDESAIFAAGVDGLTLRGNEVEGACGRGARPDGGCAVRVRECARVEVAADNAVDTARQGARFAEAVRVTPAAARPAEGGAP